MDLEFLAALEKGDLEKAEVILDRIRNGLPRSRFLHLEGLLLQRKGDFREAIKRFDMALVLHLSDPELWAAKAKALESLGKLDMARRAAERACKLSPEDAYNQLLCASILYSLKDFKGSMAQVDKALGTDPGSPAALTLKGILISIIDQDYVSALSYFDAAIDRDPDHGKAWCNRGIALRQIGDRDGALLSLQKALLIDIDDHVARDMLLSMGEGRYIPKAPPISIEQTLIKEGPSKSQDQHLMGELIAPEEWREEKRSSPDVEGAAIKMKKGIEAKMPTTEEGKTFESGSKKGTTVPNGPEQEKVDCPRCKEAFEPVPDDKGFFRCPSCGLRGRVETE